jgi:hypothetical protein
MEVLSAKALVIGSQEQCNTEFRKQERYCKEQREVLRALEDVKAQERTMCELDVRPVQSKLAA